MNVNILNGDRHRLGSDMQGQTSTLFSKHERWIRLIAVRLSDVNRSHSVVHSVDRDRLNCDGRAFSSGLDSKISPWLVLEGGSTSNSAACRVCHGKHAHDGMVSVGRCHAFHHWMSDLPDANMLNSAERHAGYGILIRICRELSRR